MGLAYLSATPAFLETSQKQTHDKKGLTEVSPYGTTMGDFSYS